MTTIDQKERYLQQAALCYEIAGTMSGEGAASMVRLAEIYAALAEDPDTVETPAIYVERPTGTADDPRQRNRWIDCLLAPQQSEY